MRNPYLALQTNTHIPGAAAGSWLGARGSLIWALAAFLPAAGTELGAQHQNRCSWWCLHHHSRQQARDARKFKLKCSSKSGVVLIKALTADHFSFTSLTWQFLGLFPHTEQGCSRGCVWEVNLQLGVGKSL